MKSVIKSLHPEVCERIVCGKQTIIVAKSAPKEVPFKGYIYQTKKRWIYKLLPWLKERQAKVIGSFICDEITRYEGEFWDDDTYERIQEPWEPSDFAEYSEYEYDTIGENGEFCGAGIELSKQSCLSWNELRKYVGQGLKDFYGWHITAPKLFDKPRELSEFYIPCKWYEKGKGCPEDCALFDYEGAIDDTDDFCLGKRPIIRPPQSFCYIEEY